MLRFVVLLAALALGSCSSARMVSHEELRTSVETTYDRWLYVGSAHGRHRFVVRSARLEGMSEVVEEHEVEVSEADLPLATTMPPTRDRSRWSEFFSRVEPGRPVGQAMEVARVRRSLDYIPAPFAPADR